MIVSSPAIEPTISLIFMASIAAQTALAIPDTVFITRIFCAISIDKKPSLSTLSYFWERFSGASVITAYFCLPPAVGIFVSLSSLISLDTVA